MSHTPTVSSTSLAAGRWVIDSVRSHLKVSVKVGLFTVHGRFTDVHGTVEVGEQQDDSAVSVTVATASLTSGSHTMDALLRGAGVIDTERNPEIAFDSRALRPAGDRWELDGLLVTKGGVLDVSLQLAAPTAGPDGALVFRARGALTSKEAVRLLSSIGMDRLLGRTMELDLMLTVGQG